MEEDERFRSGLWGLRGCVECGGATEGLGETSGPGGEEVAGRGCRKRVAVDMLHALAKSLRRSGRTRTSAHPRALRGMGPGKKKSHNHPMSEPEKCPEYISNECVAMEAAVAVARKLAELHGSPQGLVDRLLAGASPAAAAGGGERADKTWAVVVQMESGGGGGWVVRVRSVSGLRSMEV
jgi:hypothetical protein